MTINENGNLVEFYRDAIPNNRKSAEEGRPIYDECDFIRIGVPGDPSTVVVEPVTPQHKLQFPRAWAAYEGQNVEIEEGTPLKAWPQISVSQVKELNHLDVRTVEQFAAMADGNVLRMGPGYQHLHTRAKQFLAAASGDADATAVHRENDELKARVKHLEEENDALKAQLKAQNESEQPKRGRPRKEPEIGD